MRRPKNPRERLSSGRPRKPVDDGATPEALARQAERLRAAGIPDGVTPRHGGAIETLRVAGHITDEQASIAEQLRSHWLVWRRVHDVPAPHACAIDYSGIKAGGAIEPDPRTVEASNAIEEQICKALRGQQLRTRELLMAVCVDDQQILLPRQILRLRAGIDACAQVFTKPKRA